MFIETMTRIDIIGYECRLADSTSDAMAVPGLLTCGNLIARNVVLIIAPPAELIALD